MAKRISIAEFMMTEEAAVTTPGRVDIGAAEADAADHAYFLIDDSRVMLLSVRRYMPNDLTGGGTGVVNRPGVNTGRRKYAIIIRR